LFTQELFRFENQVFDLSVCQKINVIKIVFNSLFQLRLSCKSSKYFLP